MESDFKIKIFTMRIFFLLFLVSQFSFAQKPEEEKKIDAQIEIAEDLLINLKTKELFSISTEILTKSEKMKYEKGLVDANYYLAHAYALMGNYKVSIKYVKKSQTYTDYLEINLLENARNYSLLGANYSNLDLYSLSVKSYREADRILSELKVRNEDVLYSQRTIYGQLSTLYERMQKQDSVYYYLIKGKTVTKKLNSEKFNLGKSRLDIAFGDYFMKQVKSDSAEYYYKNALTVLKDKNHPFKIGAFLGLGNFYNKQNTPKEATEYYLKAIEATKKYGNLWALDEMYKGLSEVYANTGDYRKSQEYKVLHEKARDSTLIAMRTERNLVVNDAMKIEKEVEVQKSKDELIKIAFIVGILILIISIGAFYFIKRKRKELITEKENIIQEKEVENQDLKQKVNESFEEVVHLAKDNSPEFFTRFKEVYPEIISKLLEVDSKLRVTELTLCAYFFLGFTSKDVALYTFKAVNTVRNRRQNLRNKLNIPANESMELWLKNL